MGFRMDLNLNILKSFSFSFKSDYLVGMNVPANSARRDAAYDTVVALLQEDIMPLGKEERLRKYTKALELLADARETAHLVSSDSSKKTSDLYEQYLNLLIDTMQAAASLLNHELILQAEEKGMQGFIGNKYSSQSKQSDEIFSKSEGEIFKTIVELVRIAESPIRNLRAGFTRKFNEEEEERYRKAKKEFTRMYSETTAQEGGGEA